MSLPADQANHPNYNQEWWYLIGHLSAGGHQFGFEVAIARFIEGVPQPTSETQVMISDVTGNRHYQQVTNYPLSQLQASASELDARLPTGSLSGPMDQMVTHATLPGGRIDLRLRATGPPLLLRGTGFVGSGAAFTYYYSLPSIAAQGTVQVRHRTYRVSGLAWLDHQHGNFAISGVNWKGKALQLNNGARISVFVVQGRPAGPATILSPDGRTTVEPDTMQGFPPIYHSASTGQSYPTRWVVRLPHGTCIQTTTKPFDQEFVVPPAPPGGAPRGVYEGAAEVTGGSWQGKKASGLAWDEQRYPSAPQAIPPHADAG